MKATVTLAGIAAAILIASSAHAEPPGSPPDSFPVTVINEQSEPIPVAGEISAEVSGSVGVTSVPSTLTDRLDLVLDGLDELNEAVQATSQPRASYVEYLRFEQEQNGCSLCNPAPGPRPFESGQSIWASFITVSTENDDGFIEFYSEIGAPVPVLRFGHRNGSLPAVITATLPQAVLVSAVRFFCGNDAEDCEVAISVVGDLAQ